MAIKNSILRIVFCVFIIPVAVSAQTIMPDMTLKEDFQAQVKSLEEFQARFNGDESKPGIEVVGDSVSRRLNIISLFDFQLNKRGQTKEQFTAKLNAFADSIMQNDVKFNALSPGLWSECRCRFEYEGKTKVVNLLLQRERQEKDTYRWAIVAAKGLKEAGIITVDKFYRISPVEHEIYFMGLQDLFNENSSHVFGYRSRSARVDELSVLLTLIYTGKLKFDLVEDQTFHCVDVPGFVFSIKEKGRTGKNSGWLINEFEKVNEEEKLLYIKNLYGDEN